MDQTPQEPRSNKGRTLFLWGVAILAYALYGVWRIETDPEPAASVAYLFITPLLFVGGAMSLAGAAMWFTQRRQ